MRSLRAAYVRDPRGLGPCCPPSETEHHMHITPRLSHAHPPQTRSFGLRFALLAAPLLLAACGVKVASREVSCGEDFAPACDADGRRLSCEGGVVQTEDCAGSCFSGVCCAAAEHASASGLTDGACSYSCEAGYANEGSATAPSCVAGGTSCESFAHATSTVQDGSCVYSCEGGYTNHGSDAAPNCQICPKDFVNTGTEDAPDCKLSAICRDIRTIQRRAEDGSLQAAQECAAADGGQICVRANSKTAATCVERNSLLFEMVWHFSGSGEKVVFTVEDDVHAHPSDFDLDCGGGTFQNGKSAGDHTCTAPSILGDVTIRMRGTIQSLKMNCGGSTSAKLVKVTKWGLNPWHSMGSMFFMCDTLKAVDSIAPNLTETTSLFYTFMRTDLKGDVENWDTSHVSNMGGTFLHSGFSGSLRKWDVSNVTDMVAMFKHSPFNGDLSEWNVSNVTNMGAMFESAASFNDDISGWDVSNVTGMDRMFYSAGSFVQNISKWDVHNVTSHLEMFDDCKIPEAHKPVFNN